MAKSFIGMNGFNPDEYVKLKNSNLKTYSSVAQLGLTAGSTTTEEVFNSMPDNSMQQIIGSEVSDNPVPDSIIVIYKVMQPRGRAIAFQARGNNQYVMLTSQVQGLTGEWIRPAPFPYKEGDTVTLNICNAGLLTSSKTLIRIMIPLSNTVYANGATISGNVQILQNGIYLYGSSGQALDIGALNPVLSIQPYGLYLTLQSTFPSGDNNQPIIFAGTVTITFQ